jgi:TadE-like protein
MRPAIQSRQKEGGQSTVELALAIVLLMTLLAGTVELGQALFTWIAMRDAAQEGAYYGSISPPGAALTCDASTPQPPPDICKRVWDNLKQIVSNASSKTVVTISFPDGSCSQGNTILVDVDYPNFNNTLSFLNRFLGGQPISIHATINDTILTSACK